MVKDKPSQISFEPIGISEHDQITSSILSQQINVWHDLNNIFESDQLSHFDDDYARWLLAFDTSLSPLKSDLDFLFPMILSGDEKYNNKNQILAERFLRLLQAIHKVRASSLKYCDQQ
jgi:hypothetical protein